MEAEFVIRPEAPADRDAIAGVIAAAFRSQREADLVDAIRASPDYVPELSLVADADGEIIGHVMVSHTELDDGATRHRIFHLAPLAVEPSCQQQGIGGALVTSVLDAAKAIGAPFVVLQGDPRYYGRFGFVPSSRHGIAMDLPSWAPPEAAQIVLLRESVPVVRGRVVYSPAFDEVEEHSDPHIREYDAADEQAIVELSLRAWAPVFASIEEVIGPDLSARMHGDWREHQARAVRDTLANSSVTVWVAEASEVLIGFVAATLDREPGMGEIRMLAVDPDHQLRGTGTALTEHATDWLRASGMRVAMVETGGDAGHVPARRVYEKASYTLLPVARYFKSL